MTSAQEDEGGEKIQQICGQLVQILRTEMGEGSRNPKMLWSSYMEAP